MIFRNKQTTEKKTLKTTEHSELHAQKGVQSLQELVGAHRTAAGCLPTVCGALRADGEPLVQTE